ncbi:tetratricopeptide repeat protein 4 [Microcaecilia unicolor]|uniref:Tetratricopeptide repeat protein 4 n=1 Tax=Microcaecilia unicolor TaxID=1415580 RepID=A0A6P7Y3X7_9AMPH|nr:tetratricopeptide repeat protein 4 [Microcaecilia unicolor]
MASQAPAHEEDSMDSFLDTFKSQKYKGGFNEATWEEEFDKIPMFMKKAPSEIDPEKNPDLACIQSLLFEGKSPEEQAKIYKDEGNDHFKEKEYKKAIAAYTEGLRKQCSNPDLNAILYTNRAAAEFYLGNYRSALNDVIAARKQKQDHLKAIVRGALCHLELKNFTEAIVWCDEGLRISSKEKKLLETRTKADRLRRAEQRDARKATVKAKQEQSQREALLQAIKDRNIKLIQQTCSEEEEVASDGITGLSLDELSSGNATAAKVYLDQKKNLHWPVLFLYPEYRQTDFVSAFHENSRFIDHLIMMFAEDLPPWDVERKYLPNELELYFEDEERAELHQVDVERSLLEVLQHRRYFVKAGTPTFLILVKHSPFCAQYFADKKVHRTA